MAPEQTAGHLRLCREAFDQLRRIQAHQGHRGSVATVGLPINFSMLLGHFAQYIRWAEGNTKVVEIAARLPPLRVGERGNIA